jgi:L-aspartate oxidase
LRHGIEIKDTEYIQYHPTGLYDPKVKDKYFLISESLRGEGAKLLNINGQRFIDELQPRNVVTKAILEEQKATKSEYQYLDISFKDQDFLKNRFPLIYKECIKRGIDITKQLIPVTPVQHYVMGGVKVDLDGQTTMDNLYACGECSCTGLHGGNRMASNSLLEALVFSRRAAVQINANINQKHISEERLYGEKESINETEIKRLCQENEELIIEHIKNVRGDLIYELVYY